MKFEYKFFCNIAFIIKNIIKSLEWLGKNSDKNDIVFSHYSKGMWIEGISKRRVLLDSNIDYIPYPRETYNDSGTLFYSRNLKTTKSLLSKYNVRYVWIDPEMKQGQVWTKEEHGLLFLFRNEETFKKAYAENGIEIWEVMKNLSNTSEVS